MKNVLEIIEEKPIQVIIGLLVFHVVMSCMVSWIAYSPYLADFHNGNGFWNFSWDSTLYHAEAIELVDSLRVGDWVEWWSLYSLHAHVKWLALLYWIFDEANPLLFELINSVVWVASVVSVYLSARILFNSKTVAGWASSFLFFPTVLISSTQLLRDPFYILGICFVTLGWVMIYHEEFKWKGAFAIIAGYYLIVSIRPYITPLLILVFFASAIVFLFRKRFILLPAFAMLIGIFFISFYGDMSKSLLYILPVTKNDKNEFLRIEANKLKEKKIIANSGDEISDVLRMAEELVKVKSEQRSKEELVKVKSEQRSKEELVKV
ncbi:MAG: hypothetical protein CMH70_04715, partial [Nitrosomonadaceae bacterium]|nr:hypothetical protein [Nitrosomonadaceae bacterium]